MAPRIPRASKAKSKKDAAAKTKGALKTRSKRAPKASKPAGVQKVKAPKRWSKKQLEKTVNEGIDKALIELEVDGLPNKYRHVDAANGKASFIATSEANMTWGSGGMVESTAAFRARRKGGLEHARERRKAGTKLGRTSRMTADDMMGGVMFDDGGEVDSEDENEAQLEATRIAKEEEERVATFGGRCFFLELPKEIRQEVYGWLLIKPQPILVRSDWTAVLRVPGVTFDHNILSVNKLIGSEATKYFYQHSTVHAKVRAVTPKKKWRHLDWLNERFIGFFRDVVVEDMEKNVGINPDEDLMYQTLTTLRMADCQLNSLTIVLSPYLIQNQMAQNALMGVVPNASAVAYTDWFKNGTDIHRVLTNTRGLRCREVFVVLKLVAQGRHGRIVIRIDAVHLPQNFQRAQIIDSYEVVKERLVSWAGAAKMDVEQIAENIEILTELASAGLSWDGIRVKIAEHEEKRLQKGGDEGGPRMRVMGEDEKVGDLKWWTRERTADKRAAEKRKLKELREGLAQTSIGTVEEMDVDDLFRPLSTTTHVENVDNKQQQPMEDIQPTSTTLQDANAPVAAPAPPPGPEPFIPIPGESAIAAAFRARRHRLRELTTVRDLPSAPAPEPVLEAAPEPEAEPAPEPEPLPAASTGTLQAVFNAGASAPQIPEFEPQLDIVATPGPFAALVIGEDGEVEVGAPGGVGGFAGLPFDDGKIGEEEVEDEIQKEMRAVCGDEEAADEDGLFFPHVVGETQVEDENLMTESGMDGDEMGAAGAVEDVPEESVNGDEVLGELEEELMAAFEEEAAAEQEDLLFPQDVDDAQMEEDAHVAEVGTGDHRVGGAGAEEMALRTMLEVIECLMSTKGKLMAALEEGPAAEDDLLFLPDVNVVTEDATMQG